ncbi:hypothetical protein BSPWISOXPB_4427 [uncultured Gammaproteobacteria bacterium]|nr:hypothetical protein BSPWISOXPB_4427 [uncultured Gammaproteobacteria bacterium]
MFADGIDVADVLIDKQLAFRYLAEKNKVGVNS